MTDFRLFRSQFPGPIDRHLPRLHRSRNPRTIPSPPRPVRVVAPNVPDSFICSICFDIYEEPCTLPCGHTFCNKCLVELRGGGTQARCPNCRAGFTNVPERTISLHDIVEHIVSKAVRRGQMPPRGTPLIRRFGDVDIDLLRGIDKLVGEQGGMSLSFVISREEQKIGTVELGVSSRPTTMEDVRSALKSIPVPLNFRWKDIRVDDDKRQAYIDWQQ